MERKIKSIERTAEDMLEVTFNDKESAVFYKWGKDILVKVSDGVLKKTLVNIKADIKATNWDVGKLRKLYI